MRIAERLSVKRLVETAAGELIRFGRSRQEPVLGFVSGRGDSGTTVVLLQPSPPFTNEPAEVVLSDCPIVSLGTDWVIEYVDDNQTYVGNYTFSNRAGTILIGPDGPTLLARETTGFKDIFQIDLSTWELRSNAESESAPIPNWNLWVCQEDIVRTDKIPILEMRIDAPTKETNA
jgi:hypothetical protein